MAGSMGLPPPIPSCPSAIEMAQGAGQGQQPRLYRYSHPRGWLDDPADLHPDSACRGAGLQQRRGALPDRRLHRARPSSTWSRKGSSPHQPPPTPSATPTPSLRWRRMARGPPGPRPPGYRSNTLTIQHDDVVDHGGRVLRGDRRQGLHRADTARPVEFGRDDLRRDPAAGQCDRAGGRGGRHGPRGATPPPP